MLDLLLFVEKDSQISMKYQFKHTSYHNCFKFFQERHVPSSSYAGFVTIYERK